MGEPGNLFLFLLSTCLYSGFRKKQKNLRCLINKQLQAREHVEDDSTLDDLIDGYLKKVGGSDFPAEDCIPHIINLMLASMTLKDALQWLLLLITKHPHVQLKIQEEVNSVLGDREPTMPPFTKHCAWRAQRRSSFRTRRRRKKAMSR
ncbi:cytochrome P450 2C26-like isoform X1 [Anneissia japonica]|uniref:cytochrome P450 2C26-like isoform X1 n=1 Tax=Anneissia japonica TaxID=1529436 RepID=UPI001425B1E2|nr:cytochrome P450 2C26-like isoform X1 [Anneissia japonica]